MASQLILITGYDFRDLLTGLTNNLTRPITSLSDPNRYCSVNQENSCYCDPCSTAKKAGAKTTALSPMAGAEAANAKPKPRRKARTDVNRNVGRILPPRPGPDFA